MDVLQSIKLGLWLARTLPVPLQRPLPYLFGLCTYLLAKNNRRTIIANQRQVLGTASPLRLQWQALRVMVNLYHSYHVLVRLPLMSDAEIRAAVVFEGSEELAVALEQGRGAIILGGHIAGFNILAPYTALHVQPAGAFVEPIQPPALFEFVSQIRARSGLELLLADREGVAGALRLLRRNGVLLIAADRYLEVNGTPAPLFGRAAYLPHGPIVLAQRYHTPILPTTLRRQQDGRLLVRLYPPLELIDTGDRPADLEANTRLMAGAIERMIGGAAEQWLIYEPVWELRPAGEQGAATDAQRPPRPTGVRSWLAPATLLLVLARPFRRKERNRAQDS